MRGRIAIISRFSTQLEALKKIIEAYFSIAVQTFSNYESFLALNDKYECLICDSLDLNEELRKIFK